MYKSVNHSLAILENLSLKFWRLEFRILGVFVDCLTPNSAWNFVRSKSLEESQTVIIDAASMPLIEFNFIHNN